MTVTVASLSALEGRDLGVIWALTGKPIDSLAPSADGPATRERPGPWRQDAMARRPGRIFRGTGLRPRGDLMADTLNVRAEMRATILFAQLDQAIGTMAQTAEAMVDLRDLRLEHDNRQRIVGDLRGYIKSAREDLDAVEALLDAEAT